MQMNSEIYDLGSNIIVVSINICKTEMIENIAWNLQISSNFLKLGRNYTVEVLKVLLEI